MTKNTKIAAIVSAAALLAIGASMTSFAATGWQEEDGTWVYYDKYEERVTDTWEKSGNNWYYLNDDGEMATDMLIEDDDNYYYVDANGAMVTNNWVEMDNTDDDDDNAAATIWYYFQANGKAYKAGSNGTTSFKTINGKKYAFDEDGKMLWGWVDTESNRASDDDGWMNATYYCGGSDDGAQMYNSWGQIHVIDERETEDEDQDYWFYFGSNGKKYKYDINNPKTWYEKTINGKKYTFDDCGKMLSEFVVASRSDQYNLPDDGPIVATDANGTPLVKYFRTAEDGARYTKGWFRVVPSDYVDTNDSEANDDTARWFYADGKGKLYTSMIKTINGKKYAFDENGEMIWGVRYLEFDPNSGDLITPIADEIDDSDKLDEYTDISDNNFKGESTNEKDGLYAFGDEETDGAMKTGAQTITIDGDTYSFMFKTSSAAKGLGQKGKKDNAFYVNGRKIKADSDNKYEIYSCDEDGKVLAKEDVKDLFGRQATTGTWTNGDDYKGDKGGTQNGFFASAYATGTTTANDYAYIVIGTSGQYIKSGTKKDGSDYKIVVKDKGKIYGIYQDKN